MNTPSPRRNLFVVWHWLEHVNKAIPVEGDDNAFLHCVSDQITGADLDKLLTATALPGTQNILLVHEDKSNLSFKEQDAMRKQWNPDEKSKNLFLYTGTFSKQIEFVYHRPELMTGLLISPGYLTSIKGMYGEIIYSALNLEGRCLLPRYFNPVWDFYAIRAKFRVFDLKENLFICLTGLLLSELSCALPQMESQDVHLLKKKYHAFGYLEGEFKKDSLKHAQDLYTALKNHLDKVPLNTDGYLYAAGRHFRELLGAMPGNIH